MAIVTKISVLFSSNGGMLVQSSKVKFANPTYVLFLCITSQLFLFLLTMAQSSFFIFISLNSIPCPSL